MKKLLTMLLCVLLCASMLAGAALAMTDAEWRAQETAGQGHYVEGLSQEEIDALEVTTLIKDPDSITGYTVTFRYKDADAERVRINGEWQFSRLHDITVDSVVSYEPSEWEPDMFPMAPNFNGGWFTYDMELNEETGVWYYTIPLPSGTWSYSFYVGGEDGADVSDVTDAEMYLDPANLPFQYAENDQDRSQVRVPFDEEKQVDDYSHQLPQTEGEIGTNEIVLYPVSGLEDVEDGDYQLLVYLPYGYDAEREEPYKVLYVSHGSGHESSTSWYNKASISFVLDDLISSGMFEPTVCVFIDNSRTSGVGFDRQNFGDNVLPYVEENYNVRADAAGRALCGLSAGGGYTRDIMIEYPELVKYYGMFSGSANDVDDIEFELDLDELADAKLFVTIGQQEYMRSSNYGRRIAFLYRLAALEVPFDYSSQYGGHQWTNWYQDFIDFTQMTLWK